MWSFDMFKSFSILGDTSLSLALECVCSRADGLGPVS